MRRAAIAVALAAASACVGYNIRASDQCATICQTAADCGFLPSALGWSASGSIGDAQADCERRCGNSPTSDATVAQLVACFAVETTNKPRWCASTDEADATYAALWASCAEISTCLQRELRDDELRGDVALTVQMMEWKEYQLHLGLGLADYPIKLQGDGMAVQSCNPALCSDTVCANLECSVDAACLASTGAEATAGDDPTGESTGGLAEACEEVCELPAGENCDTRLCRVGHLTISAFCGELAVQKISLRVYERDRLPVVEVFEDDKAEINSGCEVSTFEFKPENYELSPGPIKVTAKVEGSLTGATLAEFGYFDEGEVFDAGVETPYCMEFIGPAMTVHAGAVDVVVPVAGLDSLAGRKDSLWRRCVDR